MDASFARLFSSSVAVFVGILGLHTAFFRLAIGPFWPVGVFKGAGGVVLVIVGTSGQCLRPKVNRKMPCHPNGGYAEGQVERVSTTFRTIGLRRHGGLRSWRNSGHLPPVRICNA